MQSKTKIDRVILFAGALLPVILRLIFPDKFHHFDVTTFVEWGKYSDNMKDLYLTDCYCNYPYIGMLVSTGIMRLLGNSIFAFLLFLSLVDLMNVFLFRRLLVKLNFPRHNLIAGLIGLLPAVWIGGNLWGQIDNIGQTIIILLLLTFVRFVKDDYQQRWLLILGGILISFGLLTKQLLVFPMAPIGLAFVIKVFQGLDDFWGKMYSLGMLALGIVLPILMIDLYLPIAEPYHFSHFERVILEGSDHMDIISGNGFNIWMLFYNDMYIDSSLPIFLGLSPKLIGIFLFVALFVYYLAKYIKIQSQTYTWQYTILQLFFVLIITNIGFNVLLTGTHERYLYYFYPFLFIFLLGGYYLKVLTYRWYDLAMFIVGSLFYGFFVFGILQQYHYTEPLFSSLLFHKIVAIVHLLVFVRLIMMGQKVFSKSLLPNG